MKYCVNYSNNFRYKDIVDEIIFSVYQSNLIDVISKEEWKEEQRFILDASVGLISEPLPIIRKCKSIHNNIAVKILDSQANFEQELREADIPFFYANHSNSADEIYSLIKRGVSDVYVTESAAFNLINIGPYCHSKGVIVRIIPNIAQYKVGFKNEIPDPYKFFVRPEDTPIYEQYADVFEIIAPNDRTSVIYEIYKNKKWMGDLNKLIVGFSEDFPNSGIMPHFGPERLKCNHKCMQEKCNLCSQMKDLSAKFNDNKLQIIRTKDKEWKSETKSYKEAMQIVEKTDPSNDDQVSEPQRI